MSATLDSARAFAGRLFKHGRRAVRTAWQQARPGRRGEQSVVLILGCQRSGTDMLWNVFDLDWNSRMYGEFSVLSSQDREHRIRLNPIPDVRNRLRHVRAPLVVLKPLVESQRAVELLGALNNSRALWPYRHYRDVASSNVRKFGVNAGERDVRPMAERATGNWRSEYVPEDAWRTVKQIYREGMSPHDAAALFWYVRNYLYFDLALDLDPRVMLIKYEELVAAPRQWFELIYSFVSQPFPGPRVVAQIHPRSVGKGRKVELSPNLVESCERLLARLDAARQQAPVAGMEGSNSASAVTATQSPR
jgi:hypothetical protein